MSVKRGSTAWILKSCYLIKELEICVNTVNIELWTMKNYYCWSNAKFVRWLFDLTFYANVRSQFMQSYSWVHVSFCIRWYLQKWVVVSLRGIFGHLDFHYVKRSSLDLEIIFFLQIFISFSWLCGTSFDVLMIVCWMLWLFYLFWSSLLCLWLCWQISVSFCWYQHQTSVFKTSRWAG